MYDIFERYVENIIFGLYVNSSVGINSLCEAYGDSPNTALYSETAILLKWLRKYCKDNFNGYNL